MINFQREITIKTQLFLIFFSKLLIGLTIIFAFFTFSFNSFEFRDNFLAIREKTPTLTSAFTTWDAQHYIFLSTEGYQSAFTPEGEVQNHLSNAFYPLYPMLIKVFNFLPGNAIFWGFVLTNIFSTLAFLILYKIIKQKFSAQIANWTLITILAFPTSFYFSLMYTESLFLLLTVSFFYFLFQNNYKYASIFAILLPLTRATGILIIVPFTFHYAWNIYKQHKFDFKKYFTWNVIALSSPFIGFLLYLIFIQITTGNFKTGFRAQSFYLADNSISNLFNPIGWFVRNFINIWHNWAWHGYGQNSLLDRIFFLFFIYILYLMRKFKDKTLYIYTLTVGLVTALSGSLNSFPRYLLIIFPIFIQLAILFKNKIIRWVGLSFMIILQIIFLTYHSLNYWIA